MNNSTKKRLIAEGKLRIEAPRPHLVKKVRRKLAKTFGLRISSDVDPRWNKPRYRAPSVDQVPDLEATLKEVGATSPRPEMQPAFQPAPAVPETSSKQP